MRWPLARKGREPGWLVIDLRPGELSFVHGQYVPGAGAAIDLCGVRALEGAYEGAPHAARELEIDRYHCSTLLAAGEYQLLLVDAPNVPQSELKTAIRWRIKDMLDYHVDDATVDVLAVPSNPAGGERARAMYAVVARNETIQACVARFDEAHIPLSVIDIPELAQRNVAALFEQDDRGLAMLYLGQDHGLLTINYRHELMIARRIEVGVGELAASGSQRVEHFQRVLLELQRTLDHFDRQYAYAPVAKLMLAPEPEETGLLEYLAGNLDLPVERVHLSGAIAFGARADLDAGEEWRLFHLIGAAFRHESKDL